MGYQESLITPLNPLIFQETVLELLKEAVEKSHAEHPDKIILLDGFPRELQQAQSFEDKVVFHFVWFYHTSRVTMFHLKFLKMYRT